MKKKIKHKKLVKTTNFHNKIIVLTEKPAQKKFVYIFLASPYKNSLCLHRPFSTL